MRTAATSHTAVCSEILPAPLCVISWCGHSRITSPVNNDVFLTSRAPHDVTRQQPQQPAVVRYTLVVWTLPVVRRLGNRHPVGVKYYCPALTWRMYQYYKKNFSRYGIFSVSISPSFRCHLPLRCISFRQFCQFFLTLSYLFFCITCSRSPIY